MEEKLLLIMDGYHRNHLGTEVLISKVIALLDSNSGIFKGIEISAQNCNLNDYYEILGYILKNYKDRTKFSLLAGYENSLSMQYHNLLGNDDMTFGNFEFDLGKKKFVGRERSYQNGRMKRDLERSINLYHVIKQTSSFPELYELVEVILLHAEKESIWRGIECSIEGSAPSKSKDTYACSKG